jgi:hypothetical protein
MRFYDTAEQSDMDEWLARVTPFLTADDEHQQCVARQRELGGSVEEHCTCPKMHDADCTKPCCVREYDDDTWKWGSF